MKTINYEIEFFSQWHCGSGLSAGADMDAVVIKDKDGLPYIPGRTMKGLVREAVEEYLQFANQGSDVKNTFLETFGVLNKKEDEYEHKMGSAFFSNAQLSEEEHATIVNEKLTPYIYNKVATTAIDEKTGTAKDHSLRTIETVVPCKLEGQITDVPDDFCEYIVQSFGLIKRLGMKRNRGLGRCRITKKEGGEK